MHQMLAVLAANPVADGAGLVAMACFVASPLFPARWMMLTAYIGNNLGFALHYALLGHWTAVAMNGIMGVQTVVAIVLVHRPWFRWVYYALMPLLVVAGAITWQGKPSFLAAAATTLSTIGRMQTNEVALRSLLLAATPFWAAHDLIVGSFLGLSADVLSMATGATMLLRHLRRANSTDPRLIEDQDLAIPAAAVDARPSSWDTPAAPRQDGGPECPPLAETSNSASRLARHDLQQRLRTDRDLTGEWPIMRGDQQDRGGDAGREQRHRNPRSQPIVAMNERDHEQLADRLQVEAPPFD
jgi:hypothetical protein